MKKLLFLLGSAALAPFFGNATVKTVSNNPNSPGQYTSLVVAVDAALPGDTIYIQGSNASYGDLTLNKRLTLIGSGHNPQKQFPLVSTLGYLKLDSLSSISGSSGSRVIGLNIYSSSVGAVCHNVEFKRNAIASSFEVQGNNWLLENNIFGYNISMNNSSNVIIRNNMISYYINTSNQPSVVISNNIFFSTNANAFSTVSNATVANNIFYGKPPQGCSDCQFNKNISYGTSNNSFAYGSNISSGNLENQDPKFVVATVGSYNFNAAFDYRLTAGSPGKNAGTDGTDIGPFGGNFPIPMGGEPRIPQVKSMNISNTVVPVNGTLNVNIKAKKQD